MPTNNPLDGFPVVIDESIAWGEMDAFAHVNNIVYFRWFESARIAYFDRIAFREPAANDGVAPILASTQCRFRLPLAYPRRIRIGARISVLDRDRFTMEYRVVTADDDQLAAEGTGVVVSYHYAHQRKAPLPDAVLERIRQLEEG